MASDASIRVERVLHEPVLTRAARSPSPGEAGPRRTFEPTPRPERSRRRWRTCAGSPRGDRARPRPVGRRRRRLRARRWDRPRRAGSPGRPPRGGRRAVRAHERVAPRAAARRIASARMALDADVIVIGGGLAGLVAAAELVDAGKKVVLLDQEPEAGIGGQAWWSFGGLFFVDSPEQRRLRIKDSFDLALAGLAGQASSTAPRTSGPASGPRPTCTSAAEEKRTWLYDQGVRFLPNPGWAERGGYTGHRPRQLRAALPRDVGHRPRGGGAVRAARARRGGPRAGRAAFRHRVDELIVSGGMVTGARGKVLEPTSAARGEQTTVRRWATSRPPLRPWCSPRAALAATSNGSRELARAHRARRPRTSSPACPRTWTAECSRSPSGGRQPDQGATACGTTWRASGTGPVWPMHAIRILPGPSSMWFDATGKRLPGPLYPGFDTLGTLEHIQDGLRLHVVRAHPQDHRAGVRAVGFRAEPRHHGQELKGRAQEPGGRGPPGPVQAFMDNGEDFVVERDLLAGAGHERPDRRRPDRLPTWSARSWPATARSATPTPRTPDHRHPRRPRVPG